MKIKNPNIILCALIVCLFLPSLIVARTQCNITFSKSEFYFYQEKDFTRIQMPSCQRITQVGAPELLQRGISLIIPQDVKVEGVKILSYKKEVLGGEFFIYPTQEKVPIGFPPAPFVEPDPLIYDSDLPYPGKIMEVTGDGYMEGFHLVHLLVYPLEYIPKQRKLYLYKDIEFEIEWVDAKRSYFQPTRIDESTINKLLSLVYNPKDVELYKPARILAKPSVLPIDTIPYVIITTNYLKSTYESLKQWKTRKGTKTEIITVSEIDTNTAYTGVDLAEKIKNFIKDAKTNWQTKWILFGGDVDSIPVRYTWEGANWGRYIITDHYYSCLDDMWNQDGDEKWAEVFGDTTDLIPDGVYIGRVPLNGIYDTENFLEKLLSYERDSPYSDYQTKALFLSSFLFDENDAKRWCDSVATTIPGDFYVSGPLYQYSPSEGIDSMNQGFGIIVNCSHAQYSGNFLACYDTCILPIYGPDIYSLNNTDRYSVMFNATCLNNKLDEDCLSRYFIKSPSGGGVGYLGTADYEYYFASRAHSREFFNQIFDNGATLGEAFMDAKMIFLPSAYGNSTERTRIMAYILLGDPQMEVWTDTPTAIHQTINPDAVDTGFQTIEVCVKNGPWEIEMAWVCLSKDDEVYVTRFTTPFMGKTVSPKVGSFVCQSPAEFDNVHFSTPGWAHFVASKKNCIPVEDSIPIGYPARPGNISATAWACHSIVLQWDDSSCNEQSFQIMRKEHNDTAWSQIATVDYNVEFFNDTNVDTNHVYFYKIRAYNDLGYSDYSDMVDEKDSLCEEPGCPFVYVWNGQGFVNDNVILTGSEDEFNNKLSLTDYYLLSQSLKSKDGRYELEIREFENEVSRIDQARLFTVDYPLYEKIGVTIEGKVWIYSDPVSPISCIDQNGVDHLAEIVAKDKNYFSCKKPGYLIVNFGKLNNSGLTKPSGQMGSGGGGGFDPPPKQPTKLSPPGTGSDANIVYIDVIGENGEWTNIAKVYPRTRSVQTLVELSPYVDPDEEFKIKISWNQTYSADHIAYYRFDDTQLSMTELALSSAIHSDQGDINTLLNTSDNQRVTLSPDQSIKLSFTALPDDSTKQRGFLFVAKGYYEKLETPSDQPRDMVKTHIPRMDQNYPNPFNLSTEIRFALPDDAKVTLNIYNILGQKVVTLLDEEKSAGKHTVFWDGKDKSGAEIASGIYFYQLRAGDYKELKKMLLIK